MSLYNLYRPMGYGEVIGQEGIISSLINMVAENKVSSTMLFYGPRGTGKTTCARIFAKALNCDSPKEPGVPCGECESCLDIANDDSLNVTEIDAACFQRDVRVRLSNGKSKRIGEIVDKRLPLVVPSYNFDLHRVENKPIINWYKNGSSDKFYNVYLDSGCGEKRCISGVTLNHKVYDKNGIKKPLSEFNVGDEILFKTPTYNNIQLSILAGTLLGDSSLVGGYKSNKGVFSKNVQLQFSHNIKNQNDYFYYKVLLLNSIGDYGIRENVKSGFGSLFNVYKSKANEYLTRIKNDWYGDKLDKNITDNWLLNINEISLAFWYMDDGTHSDSDINSSSLRFYTNSFKEEEVDKLICFLNSKWGFNAYKSKENRREQQYYISIGREGGDKFFELISKYIHPSMRYKLPIKFRNVVFDDTIYNCVCGGSNLIPVKIEKIEAFKRGICKSFIRYDIEVADNHNYFVGRGVLVSNSHTGVDNMREIKASSNLVGAGGKWKIYIIDECHMLSKAAQNSALKMLEESPEKTVFILATTELHKVEGTIISRSLMFDFRPVTIDMISKRLSYICDAEKIEYEEAALALIAKIAHGGVRDSISVLERVALENDKKALVKGIVRSLGITPTEVLMRLSGVIKGDYKDAIEIADTVIREGYDIYQFLNSAMDYYRSVLMLKIGMNHLVKVEAQMLSNMDDVSGVVSKEQISKAISILEEGVEKYKYTEDKQILLEITLYKIADGFNEKPVTVVDSINQVRGPAPIDYDTINKMMEERLGKLLSSMQPINAIKQNDICTENVIAQEPQVQQKQEVRADTVCNTHITASNVQNIGQQMLSYLMANWDQFLRILKGNNCSIATVVEMSKPISFDNNTLVIEFPSNSAFYCEMFNGQMVPETSTILSRCMNVKCNVCATAEAENNCDTVCNTHITASEIQEQPIEFKFSSENVPENPALENNNNNNILKSESENQFNLQKAGVTEFHTEQPQVQQLTNNQTQSFFGQPTVNVIQEESKIIDVVEKVVSKEDEVDMNMLDNMFV